MPTLGPASLDSSVLNMPLAIMSKIESETTFFFEDVGIANVRGKVSDTTVYGQVTLLREDGVGRVSEFLPTALEKSLGQGIGKLETQRIQQTGIIEKTAIKGLADEEVLSTGDSQTGRGDIDRSLHLTHLCFSRASVVSP